jgi:hypothetical protein
MQIWDNLWLLMFMITQLPDQITLADDPTCQEQHVIAYSSHILLFLVCQGIGKTEFRFALYWLLWVKKQSSVAVWENENMVPSP